jgi:SagB-type dehydrogenase family enzyme
MNRDIQAAWKYHNETKHSWESVRTDIHYLDWSNLPLPFKVYKDVPSIRLPAVEPMGAPALVAISDSEAQLNAGSQLTLTALTRILRYSAGITHERLSPGGTIAFRAAACAGALYPIEVYVICDDLDSLPAGVYHFNPRDNALTPLRQGHYRAAIDQAADSLPAVTAAMAVFVLTAMSWRSSWKYRSRAYRYHYWDSGTILANALAVCSALDLPAKLVMGFSDNDISRLVGIDGQHELPLSLLAVGARSRTAVSRTDEGGPDLPSLNMETVPLSGCEIQYPLIPYMHAESSLADTEQVRTWRDQAVRRPSLLYGHSESALGLNSQSAAGGADRGDAWNLEAAQRGSFGEDESESATAPSTLIPLRPRSVHTLPTDGIGDVILRRVSTRRFARKQMPFEDLSTIIERSTRGLACDFAAGGAQLNDVYVIANRIDGLASGAYYYRRREQSLELVKQGEFSRDAAYLTLEQDLGGDSSATLFYMADLDRILRQLGNRGYRSAHIEAGVMLGKAYIAAYALGRGATGLTFYDDEVTGFFSPHAAGKSCTLVVAIGIPGKRPIV